MLAQICMARVQNPLIGPDISIHTYIQATLHSVNAIYNLLRRVEGGLDLMRGVLGDHVKETGRKLISDPERTKDPVDFVHKLLEEKDKYDRCAAASSAWTEESSCCMHAKSIS